MRESELSFPVPLYEVDIGGGVYHGHYFHFFELGREALLRAVGLPYPELVELGAHLTVAQCQVQYHKPLRYNDPARIRCGFVSLGNRSVRISHRILVNDVLYTEAELAMVCVDRHTGRATELPQALRDGVAAWEEGGNGQIATERQVD